MIPPSPMQLTVFGSTLYGELCLGLCRALAAPWLDPGWLARAGAPPGDPSGRPNPAAPAIAVRQERAQPSPASARCLEQGAGQVIEVPAARWQGRRGSAAAER